MPSNHRALSAAMQPSLSIAAAEHMNIVSQQERVADSLCSQPVSRSAGNAALIRFGRNPKRLKPVWEGLGKVCPLCTRKREKGNRNNIYIAFPFPFPSSHTHTAFRLQLGNNIHRGGSISLIAIHDRR